MTALLTLADVSKRFRGLIAVDGVSFAVPQGAVFAVIGSNGAGKTTLFNMIAGAMKPDSGEIVFADDPVHGLAADAVCRRGIARTFQIVQPFAGLTVRENIAVGSHLAHARRTEALTAAEEVAHSVGLGSMLDAAAGTLTVAFRKRLELARALAISPRLLLLDEVLAGLNPAEIRDMVPVIRAIATRGVTILMIEHVMQAVMSLAEHVLVLAEGRIIAQGTPLEVAADRQVVEAYLGHGAAKRMIGGTAHD